MEQVKANKEWATPEEIAEKVWAGIAPYMSFAPPPEHAQPYVSGLCWLLSRGRDHGGAGYPVQPDPITGKSANSHRLMARYILGLDICNLEINHICTNRNCVNPLHLTPVTGKENKQYSLKIGAPNKRLAFTVDQVRDIRRSNKTAAELSVLYGVNYSTILNLHKGKSYAYLPLEEGEYLGKRKKASKSNKKAIKPVEEGITNEG